VKTEKLVVGFFVDRCNYWIEHFDKSERDVKEFERFCELLGISEGDFRDITMEVRPIQECLFYLRRRIREYERSHVWIDLIELWSEFRLGDDIAQWCALAIESLIQDGRKDDVKRAAEIAVCHPLNRSLISLALSEYWRSCSENGTENEFISFCEHHGVEPPATMTAFRI